MHSYNAFFTIHFTKKKESILIDNPYNFSIQWLTLFNTDLLNFVCYLKNELKNIKSMQYFVDNQRENETGVIAKHISSSQKHMYKGDTICMESSWKSSIGFTLSTKNILSFSSSSCCLEEGCPWQKANGALSHLGFNRPWFLARMKGWFCPTSLIKISGQKDKDKAFINWWISMSSSLFQRIVLLLLLF